MNFEIELKDGLKRAAGSISKAGESRGTPRFGATGAAPRLRRLVERSGARVFCSPRGKGVFPESHPQYVGVTGLGGHRAVTDYMLQQQPKWVLVLGTRLGEATSFWDRDMLPGGGFIHVDVDPDEASPLLQRFDNLIQHGNSKNVAGWEA